MTHLQKYLRVCEGVEWVRLAKNMDQWGRLAKME